jgi:hypothetical protein
MASTSTSTIPPIESINGSALSPYFPPYRTTISVEMLNEQMNLDAPSETNLSGDIDLEKRKGKRRRDTFTVSGIRNSRLRRFQIAVLRRGFIPLVLRLIAFVFAIVALVLASYIVRLSINAAIANRPSTVMAFTVNSIAMIYLPWIAKV